MSMLVQIRLGGPLSYNKRMEESLIYRLRKRAEIRRNIQTRKSVQEGKPDRIADILEEAADEIERLEALNKGQRGTTGST